MCSQYSKGKGNERRREEREETTEEILRALGDYDSGLAKFEARRLSRVRAEDSLGLLNMGDLDPWGVTSTKPGRSIREAIDLRSWVRVSDQCQMLLLEFGPHPSAPTGPA